MAEIVSSSKDITVYKNACTEIMQQIKELKFDSEVFDYYSNKKSRVERILNKDQYLCIDGESKYFITHPERIESVKVDNALDYINKNFSIVECFNKTFGDLYHSDGYSKLEFQNDEVLYYIGGVYCNTPDYIYYYIPEKASYSRCSIRLDFDGNIVIGDISDNIHDVIKNKYAPKTKRDLFKVFVDFFEVCDNYKIYKNKVWGGNKGFMFIFEEKTKIRKIDSHYFDYQKVHKDAKPITREEILFKILSELNKLPVIRDESPLDLSEFIDLSKVKPEKPKPRKQKTKIKESDYCDVICLKEYFENEDLTEDDLVVLEALRQISNSVNIPENSEIVENFIDEYIPEEIELPSFSFSKGEEQEDHSGYTGLVKFPFGIHFTFSVAEGSAEEITWSHSIYNTDIVDIELVN